ncbi:MAG: hypothetical protein AAF449_12565 [Myxococcota bacterium]
MLRPPKTQVSQPVSSLRKRLVNTVAAAFLGGTLGLLYARFSLPDEQLTGRLPAMYGTLGAVVGILGFRVVSMFREILSDYFPRDS